MIDVSHGNNKAHLPLLVVDKDRPSLLSGILLKHKKSTDVLNKEWAKSVLQRMGYTKQRANSTCKVLPDNFEEIKMNFLANIHAVVEIEDVPPSLIINWEHTATKIVPSSQWTMEKKE